MDCVGQGSAHLGKVQGAFYNIVCRQAEACINRCQTSRFRKCSTGARTRERGRRSRGSSSNDMRNYPADARSLRQEVRSHGNDDEKAHGTKRAAHEIKSQYSRPNSKPNSDPTRTSERKETLWKLWQNGVPPGQQLFRVGEEC